MQLELERTFLARFIPKDIKNFPYKECLDLYLPEESPHPVLRLRKLGDRYEMTKKQPEKEDRSEQTEHTISLSEDEFKAFEKVPGKRVRKLRYYIVYGARAEIDIFQDDLTGLVLIDFEFANAKEKASFTPPDFCLTEVTQELAIAGGNLAGKSYADIASFLRSYDYRKLTL